MVSQAQQQQEFYDKEFKTIVSPRMEENIRQFYFEKIVRILEENNALHSGNKILEVGTGQGGIMQRMVDHFSDCDFEGIDISEKNVEIAQSKGLNVRVADANTLQVNEQYDFIYGTAILHHLDDLPKFFKNVSHMLKPGGYVLFGPEPVWYAFIYIVYHHIRGSWPIEKGMMRISITNVRKLMQDFFENFHFYRHGTSFVYFSRRLGKAWNWTQCSKIPFLNDIYVFACKK